MVPWWYLLSFGVEGIYPAMKRGEERRLDSI
jgi:hypothetical protein